jgi:hypothetical protein
LLSWRGASKTCSQQQQQQPTSHCKVRRERVWTNREAGRRRQKKRCSSYACCCWHHCKRNNAEEAKAMQPNQNTNTNTNSDTQLLQTINSCPFLFLALFLFVVAACPPSKVTAENHETKRGVGVGVPHCIV